MVIRHTALRRLFWLAPLAFVLLIEAGVGSLWWASGELLLPSWQGANKDLSECCPAAAVQMGDGFGNLRVMRHRLLVSLSPGNF